MRPLRGLQETRVATREESGVFGFTSRRGLTPRGSLECNPEIPAFPGELGLMLVEELHQGFHVHGVVQIDVLLPRVLQLGDGNGLTHCREGAEASG